MIYTSTSVLEVVDHEMAVGERDSNFTGEMGRSTRT